MKNRSSRCCCYWLTLLLVGSSIVCVSPDSSTTATSIFHHPLAATFSKRKTISVPNKLQYLGDYLLSTANQQVAQLMKFQEATKVFPLTGSNLQPLTLDEVVAKSSDKHKSRSGDSIAYFQFDDHLDRFGDIMSNHYTVDTTTHPLLYVGNLIQAPLKRNSQKSQQSSRRSVGGRNQREVELKDEGMDKCRLFTQGEDDQNILYSPDYPNDYPKNINCTRVIEAPEGQLIRLDFRNSFHIEDKEDCKFDYLEVRDGAYGFSNLIGKFCGDQFPPMITSKERHLWLHFHSDESIEYSGFTAVFEFFDRPKNATSRELNCTIERDGYEGFINSTDIPPDIKEYVEKHKIPLDCMWRIKVNDNWKIQVKFLFFSLSKPNDCDTNFIDIFAEDTNIPSRVKNFCGSTGESVSSETNILHIRFYAEQAAMDSSFKILYTAFRDKGSGTCTEGEEYDCEDATCIAADLRCNGRDNCKFRWDEEDCKDQTVPYSEHVVIIIIVFGLILGGMVTTFLVNCIRKIMRDQKIIREHIRQSKESKLNELGRASSKARSRDNLSAVLSPRQKHSQTSLQILDDVSNRFYRDAVPISVQTSKADLREHSILRSHHDMVVQTSLQRDDSGTPDRTDIGLSGGKVCDMGCQTRESLFQTAGIIRQKSISSSRPHSQANVDGGIRFSTFGYDMQQKPTSAELGTRYSTHGRRTPYESIEMEERDNHYHQKQQPHNHHQRPSGLGSGSLQADITVQTRPQEACHHHHQHQQHKNQHHQHQHQHQQQQNQATYQPTQAISPPDYHQQQQQQQHMHHHHTHHHPSQLTGTNSGASLVKGKNKHQKTDESKVFIDIRNSAPDVIIMTSH